MEFDKTTCFPQSLNFTVSFYGWKFVQWNFPGHINCTARLCWSMGLRWVFLGERIVRWKFYERKNCSVRFCSWYPCPVTFHALYGEIWVIFRLFENFWPVTEQLSIILYSMLPDLYGGCDYLCCFMQNSAIGYHVCYSFPFRLVG